MNKFTLALLFSLLLFKQQISLCQNKENNNWWILPGTLVGLGVLAQQQGIKDFQTDVYHRSFHDFHTSVDDILQYTPTLINVGLTFANSNVQSRKAKVGKFVIGTLGYVVVTQGLKRTLNETRPNGGEHSFPSGHTATAFFGAHLLAKEVANEKPWLAYVGYGLATTTGVLRMANNEHWLSDVLVGAGIGIGAAEIASIVYPKLQQKWGGKNAIQWSPMLGNQFYGMQVSWKLNK